MRVWYSVKDLDAGRAFYREKLGFEESYVDKDARWAKLERGGMQIALAEGEAEGESGVATVDVEDVKAEAERLRGEGIEVGKMRLLDVYDPDGNRIQLAEDVS
jgi:catechol 2,3-dioxygenase-like lactoylglutathione lyase family enzyme